MCPHARSDWRTCPWCTGLNDAARRLQTEHPTMTVTATSVAADVPDPRDAEIADMRERLATVERERDEARRPPMCDVCVGTGDPGNGRKCICGGTGVLYDTLAGMRLALFDAERERDEARLACAEMAEAYLGADDALREPGHPGGRIVTAFREKAAAAIRAAEKASKP